MIHDVAAHRKSMASADMTDGDFRKVATIALRDFGLNLPDSKKSLVASRLSRRLRALEFTGYDEYFALLESPSGADEKTALLSTLTTNVTRFFRESHHFDHLRDEVLPGLIDRAKSGGRVRLWSAGCSSGEEVYSMALVINAAFPDAGATNTKILATDIDPAILEKAKTGSYAPEFLDDIPTPLKSGIQSDPATGRFGPRAAVKSLITFGITNLVAELPVSGPFDAIFCRNVAIYFDKPTQSRVWAQFSRLLAPGGFLYIGHSERLSGPAVESLKNVGITMYQKI